MKKKAEENKIDRKRENKYEEKKEKEKLRKRNYKKRKGNKDNERQEEMEVNAFFKNRKEIKFGGGRGFSSVQYFT